MLFLRVVEVRHEIDKPNGVGGGIRAHDKPDHDIKIVDANGKRLLSNTKVKCNLSISYSDARGRR